MICEHCGANVQIADWPFCPHGRSAQSVIADEIPGGMVVENGFDVPIRVYSHSEHRRRLAENGYEIRAKWAGPQDRHLTRWDTVDLDAAAALVQRGADARRARLDRCGQPADAVITVTELGTFTGTDL